MLKFLRHLFSQSLRARLMIIIMPLVALPIIATGYVLKERGKETILEEKQKYLQGIALLLEQHLREQGGFHGLLSAKTAENPPRALKTLTRALSPYTDGIAAVFDGVGVGYFSKKLNAIVTYGPSLQYGHTVGTTIQPEHPGWRVMAENTPMTVSGRQVRGEIMNAMRPIYEGDQVVGYLWANELLDAIDEQATAINKTVYLLTFAGLSLSLLAVFFAIAHLTKDVEKIRHGLEGLHFDLAKPIPPITGEVGIIIDAINHMAQTLLEMRSMHHNILDSLGDGVITIDAAHTISYANPAACTLMGHPIEEMIGKPYLTLFQPKTNFSSLLIDTLKSGQAHRAVEMQFPLIERTLTVLSSTSRLYDGQGKQIGAVAVIRDISENRALQGQLARASQLAAIGEMSASIAHELRTPLTSIRGFVQYLQDSDNKSEWKEYGDIIIREVDALNQIATGLLDLARPQPINPQPTHLNHLVEESLLLMTKTESKVILFNCLLAPDLPELELDKGQVKQVIINLLINAVQAIEKEGTITVTTAFNSEEVLLTVEDNGCGIPLVNMPRIFDPFFSSKPSGTGLGLALAQRMMEHHNALIEVSSSVGKGSLFRLRFPIAAPLSA